MKLALALLKIKISRTPCQSSRSLASSSTLFPSPLGSVQFHSTSLQKFSNRLFYRKYVLMEVNVSYDSFWANESLFYDFDYMPFNTPLQICDLLHWSCLFQAPRTSACAIAQGVNWTCNLILSLTFIYLQSMKIWESLVISTCFWIIFTNEFYTRHSFFATKALCKRMYVACPRIATLLQVKIHFIK